MKKVFILFFCFNLCATLSLQAQRKLGGNVKLDRNNNINLDANERDSLYNGETKIKLSGKTTFKDYKIISHKRDTTYVDTSLTILKDFTFNFLRKDDFELLAFHNQGQTFTTLGYDYANYSPFPDIGFTAKQFSYLNTEDINYYQVATPTTEIMYRTGMQQGQVLSSLFTLNFSKRFNVAIAYNGIRSLGQYRRALASQGNFRTSFHYETKENQYTLRGHIATQDFLNQENGGLTTSALAAFERDDPNFSERGRLDVNLSNTENLFEGSRVYFEHDYKLFSAKDSATNKDFSNLKLGHILQRERKTYSFTQTGATTSIFGSANATGAVKDEVTNTRTSNQVFLEFNSSYVLGTFRVSTDFSQYEHGYDTILNANNPVTDARLSGNAISFGAKWNAKIKGLRWAADAQITPGNSVLGGNYIKGETSFGKDSVYTFKAHALLQSKAPNFNFLLHQSTYDAYNWQHRFENIQTQNIGIDLTSKWGTVSAQFTNLTNFTYFDENNSPVQAAENISYLKLKATKEFTYKKFALHNTIMYQNVSKGSAIFRVPEFTTRNTVYYTDSWFEGDPIKVQIGATFKYFSAFKANAYNPLLAEFTLQNTTEIGFPTVDLFFNAQVQRTRIYFKIDNALSNYSSKNYFSAPNYPYRDFVIRFGLVWNWFI